MISKIDKKQRSVIGIIVAIALLAGFYMLYYDPSQKKMVQIRKDIGAKENEIRNAEIQVAAFKPLKEQVAKLEEQLVSLRAKTATSGQIISLVKTIEDEAKRLDLKVIKMFSTVHEPPPPTEKAAQEKKRKNLLKPKRPPLPRLFWISVCEVNMTNWKTSWRLFSIWTPSLLLRIWI